VGIRIISDSTTEISQEEAQELGIDIVPLRSIFGQEVYLDGIDLSPEEFYEKLEEAEELPTTSQPAPHDFEQVFRRAQAAGDQIIVLTIASKLSGTYQSACIARDACGGGGAGGGDGSGDDNGSSHLLGRTGVLGVQPRHLRSFPLARTCTRSRVRRDGHFGRLHAHVCRGGREGSGVFWVQRPWAAW